MLEETLQICLQMWRGDETPYEGRHYQLHRPLNAPQAAPAAASADHDRWRRREEDVAAGREVRRRLQPVRDRRTSPASSTCSSAHCDDVGRDYDDITKTAYYLFDTAAGTRQDPERSAPTRRHGIPGRDRRGSRRLDTHAHRADRPGSDSGGGRLLASVGHIRISPGLPLSERRRCQVVACDPASRRATYLDSRINRRGCANWPGTMEMAGGPDESPEPSDDRRSSRRAPHPRPIGEPAPRRPDLADLRPAEPLRLLPVRLRAERDAAARRRARPRHGGRSARHGVRGRRDRGRHCSAPVSSTRSGAAGRCGCSSVHCASRSRSTRACPCCRSRSSARCSAAPRAPASRSPSGPHWSSATVAAGPAAVTEANALAAATGLLGPLTVGASVHLGYGWRPAWCWSSS